MNIYELNNGGHIAYYYTLESLYDAIDTYNAVNTVSDATLEKFSKSLPTICLMGNKKTLKFDGFSITKYEKPEHFPDPTNLQAFAKWIESTVVSQDDDLCYCMTNVGDFFITTQQDSAEMWAEDGRITGFVYREVDGTFRLVIKESA